VKSRRQQKNESDTSQGEAFHRILPTPSITIEDLNIHNLLALIVSVVQALPELPSTAARRLTYHLSVVEFSTEVNRT